MCCPDLEALFINCKPFYLTREFCSFILVSVYIPPQAHMSSALQKLADQSTDTEQQHPDSVLIILGDCQNTDSMLHVPPEAVISLLHSNKRCTSLCPQSSFRTLWSLFGSSYTDLQAETEIS